MAKVVLILDSATGHLVDVAGNMREGGRYAKFVRRFLSSDRNPVLDYGVNGGDSLVVCQDGEEGKKISLMAELVSVSGDLEVGGKTLSEAIRHRIVGAPDEIVSDIVEMEDPDTGLPGKFVVLSLDQSVLDKLAIVDEATGGMSNLVKKSDIADVVRGISVDGINTIAGMKEVFSTLIERLAALGGESSSSSDSSDSSSSPISQEVS